MSRWKELPEEARKELCHEVLEHLSELVEGDADPELQRRVETLLADCPAWHQMRETFVATIALGRSLGNAEPSGTSELYEACVATARREAARRR